MIEINFQDNFLIILIGVITFLYLLKKYMQGKQFVSDIRVDGKVIIVTGCNTGIGRETVLDLARRGAKIYMACRDHKRCEEARLDIMKKTGNQNIFNRTLDLASLQSIKEFVKKFHQEEKRLDILINNAGYLPNERIINKHGYEMTFAVNHLGPFLLTNLLLDTIRSSAPSRIVNVSSIAHKWSPIDKNDLHSMNSFNKWTCYGKTKLANILFTRELAKRLSGTGVTTNSLHPGSIKTDIGRHLPIYKHLFYLPAILLLRTPKSGAQTTLMVALDPTLNNVTGKYFDNCKLQSEHKMAKDDEMAKWLWEKSEELTDLETIKKELMT